MPYLVIRQYDENHKAWLCSSHDTLAIASYFYEKAQRHYCRTAVLIEYQDKGLGLDDKICLSFCDGLPNAHYPDHEFAFNMRIYGPHTLMYKNIKFEVLRMHCNPDHEGVILLWKP